MDAPTPLMAHYWLYLHPFLPRNRTPETGSPS